MGHAGSCNSCMSLKITEKKCSSDYFQSSNYSYKAQASPMLVFFLEFRYGLDGASNHTILLLFPAASSWQWSDCGDEGIAIALQHPQHPQQETTFPLVMSNEWCEMLQSRIIHLITFWTIFHPKVLTVSRQNCVLKQSNKVSQPLKIERKAKQRVMVPLRLPAL